MSKLTLSSKSGTFVPTGGGVAPLKVDLPAVTNCSLIHVIYRLLCSSMHVVEHVSLYLRVFTDSSFIVHNAAAITD